MININEINVAKSYQSRNDIDKAEVNKYAEQMNLGDVFPPIILFNVNGELLIADGWHRYFAHKKNNKVKIDADIRKGSMQEYKHWCWFKDPNKTHGRPITNKDKLKKLRDSNEDLEVQLWTDIELAQALGVSTFFVAKHRVKGKEVQFQRGGKTITRKATNEKPQKVEEPQPDPLIPKHDPNVAAIDYLTKENEDLKQKVALAFMDGDEEDKDRASQLIESLKEEIRLLQIENRALKSGMDKYQREASQLRKQVAMLERKLK